YWCGADAAGDSVARGQSYSYDLSVKVLRQYVGSGTGPRCSRGETLLTTGPGAPACLVDSLDVASVGVVAVAPVTPGSEPLRPYCYLDLLMLTDKARGFSWPELTYPRWYFTGALAGVWGEDFSITPSAIGCGGGTFEQRAACVLSATSAFGIVRPPPEPRHLRTDSTDLGQRIVRFQQVVQGYDVSGSQALVTIESDGRVSEVFSHFIPNVRVVNSRRGVFEEDFAVFDEAVATASIIAEMHRLGYAVDPPPAVRFGHEHVLVRHGEEDPSGHLAVIGRATIGGGSGTTYGFVVDIRDGTILLHRPVIVPDHAVLDSMIAYPSFSTATCTVPASCTPPLDWCVSDSYEYPRCVDACSADGDCQGALYLVYTTAGGALTVSRCTTPTEGCSDVPSRWTDFRPGEKSYYIPGELRVRANPTAVASAGVFGTSDPGTEYLYVAATTYRTGYSGRIYLLQIGPDLAVRRSTYMPEHYPSSTTRGPVAIIEARSAFGVGNYLYLAWADRTSSELHVSIVQKWDDAGLGTWITRPARMGLTILDGPSWSRGVPPQDRSGVQFAFTSAPAGALRYTFLYGRY
ncbi:MAG: hypothetical protein QME96_13675, partial [Myxococcota bacterium]|nr:hypothetical protein [Myxococcota bacterium]